MRAPSERATRLLHAGINIASLLVIMIPSCASSRVQVSRDDPSKACTNVCASSERPAAEEAWRPADGLDDDKIGGEHLVEARIASGKCDTKLTPWELSSGRCCILIVWGLMERHAIGNL